MKQFLLFVLFLFLCNHLTEAQTPTFADPPGPEHVLVVYNTHSDTSGYVKDYYMDARNIPEINELGLENLDTLIDITHNGVTHTIYLDQQGEIIRDMDNAGTLTPTIHAWIYFNERIAKPIANYLTTTYVNGTPLKDIIRFIVLVKGVPFRIDARQEDADSRGTNVICANLLTHLGETMNDLDTLLFYYNKTPGISNPYYNVDPNFSMEHHFLPNHFQTTKSYDGQIREIPLSYLVTHLSAPRFEDIQGMIDRSVNAINETDYDWFIDAKEAGALKNDANATKIVFDNLGIENYYFETTDERITNHEKAIMAYSSDGTWAGFLPDYIQSQLQFTYSDGAFFNTWESHNGLSIGTYPVIRTRGQGLLADFTLMGGTIGVGQAFHSPGSHVIRNHIFFPAYALGYTFIEAAYLGLSNLDGTNVVVGDPLTRIYDCPATVLTSNTTISSGNYDCDIIVPEGISLTIAPSSIINFSRNATLKVKGTLIIEINSVINFNSYSHLFLDENSELDIQQNSSLNFNNFSTLFTKTYLYLYENSKFNFGFSSTLISNGSLVIGGNLQLSMNKLIINGDAELLELADINLDVLNFNVNGSLTLKSGSLLNLYGNSLLQVYGNLFLQSNSKLDLNSFNKKHINYGTFLFHSGSEMNIKETSEFSSFGKIYLEQGVIINQNNSSTNSPIQINGVFISSGSLSNPVIINYPAVTISDKLNFTNVDTLILSHTTISYGSIVLSIVDELQKPRLCLVTNSVITNSKTINTFAVYNTESVNIILSDNYFSSISDNGIGMTFSGFNSVQMIRNTIENVGSVSAVGVGIFNNKSLEIIGCDIIGFKDGIKQVRIGLDEIDISNNEDIRVFNSDIIGIGDVQEGVGISVGYNQSNTTGLKIDQNNISGFSSGITVNNDDDFALGINNNTITNYGSFGISVSNGSEAVIKENLITSDALTSEYCVGISVNQVNNPSILGNTIDAYNVSNPGSGISLVSCNGEIRRNTIQNHLHGIEIGSSSPKIGANTITNNKAYGIYISDNSNPDLTGTFVGDDQFPLSGYNTIRENGLCEETRNSELYLLSSLVKLEKGCNTIADDRDGVQQICNNLYLVDGRKIPETVIQARGNYWGNHPVYGNDPTGRFGDEVTIDYSEYFSEPCTYSQGEAELILANSKGEVYDTLYSTGNTATGLSDIESRYAAANNYFYINQYNQAKQEYEGIIQNYGNDNESIQAYNRLYTIAKLTNSSPASFTQLKDYYLQRAANQTDSLIIGTLTHLGDLCLVSAEEYLPAINNFDEIAQQNPNTDIALYRQIDALTTSLLVSQDSTLNKGILGKYSVDNLSDYTNKLSELLKTRGKSGFDSEKELLPTEYTLYQNYPNPFNPITTIKYDLPNTSDVSLIIYDILGRKVKELVNTKQQAGRYEIQFNASSLSSGVYIYQLIAEKYMSSRKMILLR